MDIRQSFDDSSAPLLQHDDRENQLSTASVQFDLEYAVQFSQPFLPSRPFPFLDLSLEPLTALGYRRLSEFFGVCSGEIST